MPDAFDTVQNTDFSPRFPQADGAAVGRRETDAKAAAITVRTRRPSRPAAQQPSKKPRGEGYELNFENAAVATVAKVILGDILNVGYIIDPRVQGTVTIASGRPVPKNDLILVLENALRMSNVVLVTDSGGGYRLIPGGDAQGAGGGSAAIATRAVTASASCPCVTRPRRRS